MNLHGNAVVDILSFLCMAQSLPSQCCGQDYIRQVTLCISIERTAEGSSELFKSAFLFIVWLTELNIRMLSAYMTHLLFVNTTCPK